MKVSRRIVFQGSYSSKPGGGGLVAAGVVNVRYAYSPPTRSRTAATAACLAFTRDTGSELHFDVLLRGVIVRQVEELALLEAQGLGDHVAGEDLHLDVQVAGVGVVEAAGGLDLILGVAQLVLEVQEVLVGLQVRIRFGNREERLQRARKHVFGGG